MTDASIGEQELTLLRHIADRGGASVGEVAETFGEPRGLARSTVLTMMERLRKKGLLARKLAGGVFRYRAQRSSAELLQGAVERFVERHLDGSVSPFLAYLSDTTELSDQELSELEEIVGRLKAGRKKIGGQMIGALIRASIGGAAAVAVVWTIGRLAPRLSPAVRTTLWWLAAAKFLISLVWISPIEIRVLPTQTTNVVQAVAPSTAGGADATPAAADSRQWNLETLAVALWAAGALIAIALGARQWRRASMIVRTSRPVSDELTGMAADLAARLGIVRVPSIRASDLVDTPLVTGLRRSTVVVPAHSFHRLSLEQQQMALCHELAHVKRADLSLGAIPALAERVFFFHPLVHVASREYSIWREAACDRDVLDALDAAPDEYGQLLVNLGVSHPRAGLAAAGASWSFTSLKRRLSMLTESPNRSKYSRAIAIAAVGVAALTLMPLTLSARPVIVVPDAAAQERPVETRKLASAEAKEEPGIHIVLFGDKTRLRGERSDVIQAMNYRVADEKLVWFRVGDAEFLLRDAAALKRVDDAWEKALTAAADPDMSYIDALLKRFAEGGLATKVK